MLSLVGLLGGSVDRPRAEDGASGRPGGAMEGGARGRRRRILCDIILFMAQLRHRATGEHRGELAGNWNNVAIRELQPSHTEDRINTTAPSGTLRLEQLSANALIEPRELPVISRYL